MYVLDPKYWHLVTFLYSIFSFCISTVDIPALFLRIDSYIDRIEVERHLMILQTNNEQTHCSPESQLGRTMRIQTRTATSPPPVRSTPLPSSPTHGWQLKLWGCHPNMHWRDAQCRHPSLNLLWPPIECLGASLCGRWIKKYHFLTEWGWLWV